MVILLICILVLSAFQIYYLDRKTTGLKQRLSELEKTQKHQQKELRKVLREELKRSRAESKGHLGDLQTQFHSALDRQSNALIEGMAPPLQFLTEHADADPNSPTQGLLPVNNRPQRYVFDKAKRINSGMISTANPGGVVSHGERVVDQKSVGKLDSSYRPTYQGFGDSIDATHEKIREIGASGFITEILGVKGKLLLADALKLYELGYFAKGNVLELGCSHGLSTCLLSAANHASGLRKEVYTIDLSRKAIETTRANLEMHALGARVFTLQSEGADGVSLLSGRALRFDFAFIDHSHAYGPVKSVVKLLPEVLNDDAFVLFHDYNDTRNFSERKEDYGVVSGIVDAIAELSPHTMEYWGCFGCTGLYRFQVG